MTLKLPPKMNNGTSYTFTGPKTFRYPYEQYESSFAARLMAEFIYYDYATLGFTDDLWDRCDDFNELLWDVVPKDTYGRFEWSNHLVSFDGRPFDTNKIQHCWWWRGPQNEFGYPTSDVVFSVHRAIYEVFEERKLGDLQAHHRCRNKCCIKPFHIQAVTEYEHLVIHRSEDWS